MTIDERLEFLVQSTESLHASVQEMHEAAEARFRRMEARDARLRQAVLAAMAAYMTELKREEEEGNGAGGNHA